MLTVEILRSFAIAVYPGSTVALNLATGSFFQVDAEATSIVLALARGTEAAAVEQRIAELCKIPRYAAKERVRALQLQLISPCELASSQGLFVRTMGAVSIRDRHGRLHGGEPPLLRGAMLRAEDGAYLLAGPKDSDTSLLCRALGRGGFKVVRDGVLPLSIKNGSIDLALAQAWFLESKRSSGLGLTLATCSAGFVVNQLLTHTTSTHSRGGWVELFTLYAALAADLPAFRVSMPEGALTLEQAAFGYTHARRARAQQERA